MDIISYRKNRFEVCYKKAGLLDKFYSYHPVLFTITLLVIAVIDFALGVMICK